MKTGKLKIMAMVMALVMFITGIPTQWIGIAAAQETEQDIYIVCEAEEYRDKYSKTYLKSDGTYTRILMADAVHAWDDEKEKWVDVDNTLTQKNGAYTNAESDMDVSLPVSLTPQSKVKVASDGYEISMQLDGAQNALGRADNKNVKQQIKQSRLKNSDTSDIVETLGGTSELNYSKVFDNTGITYHVDGDRLKEDITLDECPSSAVTYTYRITANDLTAVLNDDNSISFYDMAEYEKAPEKSEARFTMPAPNMYDSADAVSYDIAVTLSEDSGLYVLTYAPDYSWLTDESRVYPVTVDPTIYIDNIYDSTYSGNPYLNIGKDGYMCAYPCFSDYSGTVCDRIVPRGMQLVKAQYYIKGQLRNCDDDRLATDGVIYSTVHRTVNNSSNPNPLADDVLKHTPETNDIYQAYDITNIVYEWINTNNIGYGMVFKAYGDIGEKYFRAYSVYDTDGNAPYIELEFADVSSTGNEVKTLDMGSAGTMTIDAVTGRSVINRTDVAGTGNIMPVDIQMIYNRFNCYGSYGTIGSNSGMDVFGYAVRTNYTQTLKYDTPHEYSNYTVRDTSYIYTLGNGQRIHFVRDNTVTSETENAEAEYFKDSTDSGYTLHTVGYDGNNFSNYTDIYKAYITDSSDNKYYFDSSGRLIKIVGDYPALTQNVTRDSTPGDGSTYERGVITITYKNEIGSTSLAIDTITDGMGHVYEFNYEQDTNYYLSSITCDGVTEVSYPDRIWNTNTHSASLPTKVTYQNAKSVSYTWNSDKAGELTKIVDSSGMAYEFSYTGNDKDQKLASVKQTTSSGTVVQNVSITYGAGYTEYTDSVSGNTELYRYNNIGQVVTIQDGSGNAVFMNYDSDSNELVSSSGIKKTVVNLLGDIESSDEVLQWSKTNAEYISGNGYMSQKSFKIIGTGNVRKAQLLDGGSYTFSAFVKTENADGTYLDVSGDGISHIQSRTVKGTNDYQRLFVTFDAEVPEGSEDITATLKVVSSGGTTYVDAPQLESGETLGSYALVKNGDFEKYHAASLPLTPWTQISGTYSDSSPEEAVSSSDSLYGFYSDTSDNDHIHSAWLHSSYGQECSIEQQLSISGAKGDSFSFGGWSKGDALPPLYDEDGNAVRNYSITAVVTNSSTGKTASYTADFNPYYEDWQYAMNEFTAEFDYDGISVQIRFDGQTNYALFDDIQLYREPLYGSVSTVSDESEETDDTSTDADSDADTDSDTDADETNPNEDEYGRTIRDESAEGVVTEYTYDNDDNITSEKTTNGRVSILTSTEYDDYGNTVKTTDENGNSASYTYNSKGNLTKFTDAAGAVTNYGYNAAGNLTSMYAVGSTNSFTYNSSDSLTRISNSSGTVYDYVYDELGNLIKIQAGTSSKRDLVTYTYDSWKDGGALTTVTYGNGYSDTYTYYEDTGLLKTVNNRYTYYYDASGNAVTVIDSEESTRTDYYTDSDGNNCVSIKKLTGGVNVLFESNSSGRGYGNYMFSESTESDDDGRLTKTEWANNTGSANNYTYIENYYDDLSRQTSSIMYTANKTSDGITNGTEKTVLNTSYSYKDLPQAKTTNSVISVYYSNNAGLSKSISYTYDANGRITRAGDRTYTYDSLGRLASETNETSGSTTTYGYDDNGNIISRSKDNRSVMYSYGESAWKDVLTTFNGRSIGYDGLGNITSYNGRRYTWKGRQLTNVAFDTTSYDFSYNPDGLRSSKTVGGLKISYYYENGQIVAQVGESSSANDLYFHYDGNGEIAGFEKYEGVGHFSYYYYLKNLQGDVIGILDSSGNLVVEYTYDAWGKVESVTGSKADTIGALNPIRYRGYYYDTDLNMYYLQSRYYDPEMGRFISSDDAAMSMNALEDITAANLFAYCGNDPVNRVDPNGYESYYYSVNKRHVVITVKFLFSSFRVEFDVSSRGMILFNFDKNPSYYSIWWRGAARGLAAAMYYAVRSIKFANNKKYVALSGRSISGIHTELYLHWVAYKLNILKDKTRIADIGASKGTDGRWLDKNGWIFEGSSAQRTAATFTIFPFLTGNVKLINNIARYFV